MDKVREAMQPLTLKQIDVLAGLSGVPAPTIYKIKRGETPNPGIDTVAKFLPHLAEAIKPPTRKADLGPAARRPSKQA